MLQINPRKIAILLLFAIASLFILMFVGSCTCEGRLARIVKKCPSLLKDSTITIRDTIYSKEVKFDTIFNILSTKDTLIIEKDNVITKFFYNTHDSTVFIQSHAKPQMIIRTRTISVPVVVYQENGWIYVKRYWWIGLIIIALAVLFKWFRK